MARWIVSPVVGTGTPDDAYRPKAADYATEWGGIIPGNADGSPAFNWCIVRATAGDLTAADADPDLIVFPQFSMDHVLTAGERTWLINRLTARGFGSAWVTVGITVREVLLTIGRWLDNRFDITWIGGAAANE